MNVLLIDNNFKGAYGSISMFLDEIQKTLINLNIGVYRSMSINESFMIINEQSIDFSIGIGSYQHFVNGRAFYDVTKIIHYQWIIDNPLKLSMDYNSKFVVYLLIDKKFELCFKIGLSRKIYLPLGIDTVNEQLENLPEINAREEGIVFAGQIRDINYLWEKINSSTYKEIIIELYSIIENNLDVSLIDVLYNYKVIHEYKNICDVFLLLNSLVRAVKRKKVITAIKNYPVILVGDVQDESILNQRNIIHLGIKNYSGTQKIFEKYIYALNIEPNFKNGMHDRILRAIQRGAVIITNKCEEVNNVYGENLITYSYDDLELIEETILNYDRDRLEIMSNNALKISQTNYCWERVLGKIVLDYKENYYV